MGATNEAKTIIDNLWTEQELADRLAISVRTVQKMRASGEGPRYLKIGRSVRYRPQDVVEFAAGCERQSTAGRAAGTLPAIIESHATRDTCAPDDPCGWAEDGICDDPCLDLEGVDAVFDDSVDCAAAETT